MAFSTISSSEIKNVLSSFDVDFSFTAQVLLIELVNTFWELAILLHQLDLIVKVSVLQS
jgi:hypothetical protein